MKFQKVPEYKFNKNSQLSEDERQRVSDDLRNLSVEVKGKEKEKDTVSLERLAEIDYLITHQIDWAKSHLGLDLSSRIPEIRKIKFFDENEWEKITKQFKQSPNCLGINIPETKQILLNDCGDDKELYSTLNHEFVHALSRISMHVKKGSEGKRIEMRLNGFRNVKNNVFNYFNEIITEMINLEMLDDYKDEKGKDYLSRQSEFYKNGVIFMDLLIIRLAEITKRDSSEIRIKLYSAYFEGNIGALRMIKDAFGKKALQVLAGLKDNQYPTIFLEILAKRFFGINPDELQDKVKAFQQGEEVTILGGIKIKRKK